MAKVPTAMIRAQHRELSTLHHISTLFLYFDGRSCMRKDLSSVGALGGGFSLLGAEQILFQSARDSQSSLSQIPTTVLNRRHHSVLLTSFSFSFSFYNNSSHGQSHHSQSYHKPD